MSDQLSKEFIKKWNESVGGKYYIKNNTLTKKPNKPKINDIVKWNPAYKSSGYIKDNTYKPKTNDIGMDRNGSICKRSKYGAIKSAGYDSKMEHKQALLLKAREKAGEITSLKEQVKFVLQEGFVNNQGQKIREIAIIVDFCYYDCVSKQLVVDDAKGFRTADFKLKKKLFMFKYRDYVFLENGKVKKQREKKYASRI